MIINYSDQPVKKGLDSIFLAGPTPRDKSVPSWRPDALECLKRLGFDGIVYVPELSSGKAKFNYDDQVEWEWDALESAGVILFWVPRNIKTMPGLTTNLEFGSYIKEKNRVYGRPNDAESIKYLDKFFKRFHIEDKIYDNLEDLCAGAIEALKGMTFREKIQAARNAFWNETMQKAMNTIKKNILTFNERHDYSFKDIEFDLEVFSFERDDEEYEFGIDIYILSSADEMTKTFICYGRLVSFNSIHSLSVFADKFCSILKQEGFTIKSKIKESELDEFIYPDNLTLLKAVLRL